MPLETGTYINDLDASNPAHSDGLNQADSHLRLLKATLKATFPNINSAITLSDEQLNALSASGYLAPNGTVSLPSHSFASEPALGLYRVSAGRIGIAGRLLGNGAVHPGSLVDFPCVAAPTGYAECDGQSFLVADQPDLFAVIGYLHGGSGLNFNVPNYKNRFLRHRDVSGAAGAVGTTQADQNKAHTHGFSGTTATEGSHTHTGSGSTGGASTGWQHPFTGPATRVATAVVSNGVPSSAFWSGSATEFTGDRTSDHTHGFSFTTSGGTSHAHGYSGTTASEGGSEARPLAGTVLRCIKL